MAHDREDRGSGDRIKVGNVSHAQGIAIGRNAHADVVGNNIAAGARIDPGEVRTALEDLFAALGEAGLPRATMMTSQTAVGNAIGGVTDDDVSADIVVPNLQTVGETLQQVNAVVKEGTSLWQSVRKLAPLLGPIVGGAHVVAGWFGIPF